MWMDHMPFPEKKNLWPQSPGVIGIYCVHYRKLASICASIKNTSDQAITSNTVMIGNILHEKKKSVCIY